MAQGELRKEMGEEAVNLLAQFYGAGQLLSVPRSTANAAQLEIILGIADTAKLISLFGGSRVYLPGLSSNGGGSARRPFLYEVETLSRSLSAREISARFGVSIRTIYFKRARIARLKAKGLAIPGARSVSISNSHKNARGAQPGKRAVGEASR